MHQEDSIVSQEEEVVELPLYYKESFFSKDSMFYTEQTGKHYGLAGDPIPYTLKNDNTISSLLMICFIMIILSFSQSRRFIARQVRGLFVVSSSERSFESETSAEIWFQSFMVLLTSLLISVLLYFYTQHYIGTTFMVSSEYHLIAIYFVMVVGYFLFRGFLYTFVNSVFFRFRDNIQWLKSLLFITSMEGVLLFPVVMLQTYFDLPIKTVSNYVLFVFILVKILTFYKSYLIFFRQVGIFLQIILYFCALEVIPFASFWMALVITSNNLKINF